MALWEFSFGYGDGMVAGQTAIAEGTTEDDAAASADKLLAGDAGVILSRPGKVVPPEIEKRWREINEAAFPIVVCDTGRLALYARGIAEPTSREPDTVDPSQVSRFLGIQMDVAILILGLLMMFALVTWVKRTFF